MTDHATLLACYRSGQIPEAAWQEHLNDEGLRAYVKTAELISLLEQQSKLGPINVPRAAMREAAAALVSMSAALAEARKALEALHYDALELAQYASYAEIIGAIGHNRAPIRKHCDNIFAIHHAREDAARRAHQGGEIDV